jgi:predicted nuclease of predicted toxin-antitoxin system
VRFKLDENLSPTLAAGFLSAGHEAHSVLDQSLGGATDPRVLEVCRLETRALITLDVGFANIQRYPPSQYPGIMVLRLGTHAHGPVAAALAHAIDLMQREPLSGRLWIVEVGRGLAPPAGVEPTTYRLGGGRSIH